MSSRGPSTGWCSPTCRSTRSRSGCSTSRSTRRCGPASRSRRRCSGAGARWGTATRWRTRPASAGSPSPPASSPTSAWSPGSPRIGPRRPPGSPPTTAAAGLPAARSGPAAMSFLSEAILRADAQLQARLSVDVGLAQIVEQAEQAGQSGGPGGAATAARRLLVERLRALDETQSQIRRLADALAHFAKVLPFSADGWPEQRARFASLATGPPDQALVDWLDYWFVAASRRRLDALDRLHAEAPLPPGAELLRERADTAARALREPNARLAAPMLTLGCRGLVLGGRRIPDDGTRQDLALLRARLALGEILVDEAAAVLPEDTHSAAALAMRARRARMAGDPDADSLLSEAQSADPRDLDVTVELIHRARQRGEFEIALEAAREAVDALQSLADVDAELGRLVHEPAELWLAVADRARRQGDDTAAIRFLDRASEVAAWGDGEVAAVIDEARAGLLADSEAPPPRPGRRGCPAGPTGASGAGQAGLRGGRGGGAGRRAGLAAARLGPAALGGRGGHAGRPAPVPAGRRRGEQCAGRAARRAATRRRRRRRVVELHDRGRPPAAAGPPGGCRPGGAPVGRRAGVRPVRRAGPDRGAALAEPGRLGLVAGPVPGRRGRRGA